MPISSDPPSLQNFEGKLLVITAPSGAGKSTIVSHLLSQYKEVDFSVSATTRERRAHEIDGVHYYFMTHDEFKEHIENGDFAEWEEVYENQFYGTLCTEIERIWKESKHIIFDIDVKGARSIKEIYKEKCLTVFIKPPSLYELINRLKKRKTESASSLNKRIRRIYREMTYEPYFDKILVNDLLEVALKEAEFILESFLNIHSAD